MKSFYFLGFERFRIRRERKENGERKLDLAILDALYRVGGLSFSTTDSSDISTLTYLISTFAYHFVLRYLSFREWYGKCLRIWNYKFKSSEYSTHVHLDGPTLHFIFFCCCRFRFELMYIQYLLKSCLLVMFLFIVSR